MTEVLEFGRIPKEIYKPKTRDQLQERDLAQRLRKVRKTLSDQDEQNLAALEETSKKMHEEQIQEWRRSGEFCMGGKMYGTIDWTPLLQHLSNRIVFLRYLLMLDLRVI